MKKKRLEKASLVQLDNMVCCMCHETFSPEDIPEYSSSGSYQHKDCSASARNKNSAISTLHHDRVMRLEAPTIPTLLGEYEIEMLTAHNVIRQRHGVKHVLWSDKLACSARRWGIRLSVLNKEYLDRANIIMSIQNHTAFGQNVGLVYGRSMTTPQIVERCIQTWYTNSATEYDYRCEAPKPELLAFTQMLWEKTVRIGACITWFGDIGFIVVNYWPPGNVTGQFIKNVFPVLHPDMEWTADSRSGIGEWSTTRNSWSAAAGDSTSGGSSCSADDEREEEEEDFTLLRGSSTPDSSIGDELRGGGSSSEDVTQHNQRDSDSSSSAGEISDHAQFVSPRHHQDSGGEVDYEVPMELESELEETLRPTGDLDETIVSHTETRDITAEGGGPDRVDVGNLGIDVGNLGIDGGETEEVQYEYMESPQSHQYVNLHGDITTSKHIPCEGCDRGEDEDQYMVMRPSIDSKPSPCLDHQDYSTSESGTNNVYENPDLYIDIPPGHEYETLSKFHAKKKRSWPAGGKKTPRAGPTSRKDIPLVMVQSGLALAVYQEPEYADTGAGGAEMEKQEDQMVSSDNEEICEDEDGCEDDFVLEFVPEPYIEDGLVEEDFDEDNYTRNSILELLGTYDLNYQ